MDGIQKGPRQEYLDKESRQNIFYITYKAI